MPILHKKKYNFGKYAPVFGLIVIIVLLRCWFFWILCRCHLQGSNGKGVFPKAIKYESNFSTKQ